MVLISHGNSELVAHATSKMDHFENEKKGIVTALDLLYSNPLTCVIHVRINFFFMVMTK